MTSFLDPDPVGSASFWRIRIRFGIQGPADPDPDPYPFQPNAKQNLIKIF
jgi:hypothetical protein